MTIDILTKRKFGYDVSVRASERRPYRLWGKGRGVSRWPSWGSWGMPSVLGGIFQKSQEKKKNLFLFVMLTNDRGR